MLEALIDAIQNLLANTDGGDIDFDSPDFWDNFSIDGIDLSQYTADEIREALDAALSGDYDSGEIVEDHEGIDIENDSGAKEIAFQKASYLHTSETVNVSCVGGPDKGSFDVYLYDSQKYIKFNNHWIQVTKNGFFDYNGNRYHVS